ncbi:uncharacterized protein LOC142338151 [Convolutriloba macropyga]|uniref:uncharacterized protein LOC142338151 n=1 Tax=Convolutriloba macropyga TaxID=536237 RepID=UPI003F51EAD2
MGRMFRSSPGGFLLVTENRPQGNELALAQTQVSGKENSDPQQSSFSVEDYHSCHKWEDLMNALKDKQGPIFVILDLTWTKIEGGNKRQLVMIEWQQKDMSYTVARAICRRFAMHFQVLEII